MAHLACSAQSKGNKIQACSTKIRVQPCARRICAIRVRPALGKKRYSTPDEKQRSHIDCCCRTPFLEVAAAQPSGAAELRRGEGARAGMASAGRAARRDRGAVHVHSAALLHQLLDAAQRLQQHLASAARDLPGRPTAASCVSIAQACAVPRATDWSTAAHPPDLKPASRQPSPDPASTPGGVSATPLAPSGPPEGLGVPTTVLPGRTAAPLALSNAQLFPCEQELELRLPEAAEPTSAQGEALAVQAAAASCPSNAPGAGLAQLLASIAAGLDPRTGVVAEVAAILAADAAARTEPSTLGPGPAAQRRSGAPRRSVASERAGLGLGRLRNLEQPAWGRSAEGVDRRRAGGPRWRMRQGRGVVPDAGGDPVTEARARGGARSRAMLPATEWTRVRRPLSPVDLSKPQCTCHHNHLPYWRTP